MNTHPNITLSTGKVITHERMENGAQKASPEMNEREHAEYVERLTALFPYALKKLGGNYGA